MRRPYWHEWSLGAFALGAWVALLCQGQGFAPTSLALLGSLAAFCGAVILCVRAQAAKVRLGLAYVFALWLYQAVRFIVPALERAPIDSQLAALDVMIFGSAPSTWMLPHAAVTEVLSGAYLSYQLYLHLALAHGLTRPLAEAERLYERIFTAMGIGFAGYVLLPALGPTHAGFEAGPLTALNTWVVANGSSVFDAFPSLHVAITALLLTHDGQYVRRRFGVMFPVAIGLVVSTIYLRYHHAVDLLAGAALAVLVAVALRTSAPAEQPRVQIGHQ